MEILNCHNLEKIKCNGRCVTEKKSVLECTKEVPGRRIETEFWAEIRLCNQRPARMRVQQAEDCGQRSFG